MNAYIKALGVEPAAAQIAALKVRVTNSYPRSSHRRMHVLPSSSTQQPVNIERPASLALVWNHSVQ
jgi:hypothetical protein